MVDDFLDGESDEQLRGVAQKLAALELRGFEYANGLTDYAPGARYDFGVPPGLDDLRDHANRTAMLNAVPDFMPLPWLETLQRVAALPTLDPIAWFFRLDAHLCRWGRTWRKRRYKRSSTERINGLRTASPSGRSKGMARHIAANAAAPNNSGPSASRA